MTPQSGAPPAEASDESVVGRIARHAASKPRARAIEDATGVWSYRDLDRESALVAAQLARAGAAVASRVALTGPRSAAYIAALIGTFRARAVAIPVDPGEPPLFVERRLRALNPAVTLRIEPRPPGGPHDPAPPSATLPDDLAYILSTSGTTGEPKAVISVHRPLSHFLSWYSRRFGFTPQDRFPLLTALCYDPFLRDVFTPLWTGGTLVIPPAAIGWNSPATSAWLNEKRISALHAGPAAFRRLLHDSPAGAMFLSLRHIAFHGDIVRWADLELARLAAPRARIVTGYGATETPQIVAVFEPGRHQAGTSPAEPMPLGFAAPGTQLLVVDERGELLPPGEPGEILVQSRYLSSGYVDDPELTARKFLPGCVPGHPLERTFRTGDFGCKRRDGLVDFVARNQSFVKVDGCRVDTELVVRALLEHPRVSEARVETRAASVTGDPQIEGWLTLKPGGSSPEDLQAWLLPRVPPKMVPVRWHLNGALELGRTGKLRVTAGADP